VLGVHASPGCDDGEGITPHRPTAELRAALAGADAQVVFAGHTHQPTDRVVGGIRAVNLGSVSNPITDDLRASYVVLHADRHGHTIEHPSRPLRPGRLPVRDRRVRSSGLRLHRVVPAGSADPPSRPKSRRPRASDLTHRPADVALGDSVPRIRRAAAARSGQSVLGGWRPCCLTIRRLRTVPLAIARRLGMHVSVQKSTRTTWPRSSAGPGGSELSHPVAPPSEGMLRRSNTVIRRSDLRPARI